MVSFFKRKIKVSPAGCVILRSVRRYFNTNPCRWPLLSRRVHRRAPATPRRIATASAAPARRFLSTTTSEAAAAAEKPSPPSPPPPQPTPSPETSSGGSSFLQRVAAFLTGAGVGCGVGYYHLATVRRTHVPLAPALLVSSLGFLVPGAIWQNGR